MAGTKNLACFVILCFPLCQLSRTSYSLYDIESWEPPWNTRLCSSLSKKSKVSDCSVTGGTGVTGIRLQLLWRPQLQRELSGSLELTSSIPAKKAKYWWCGQRGAGLQHMCGGTHGNCRCLWLHQDCYWTRQLGIAILQQVSPGGVVYWLFQAPYPSSSDCLMRTHHPFGVPWKYEQVISGVECEWMCRGLHNVSDDGGGASNEVTSVVIVEGLIMHMAL